MLVIPSRVALPRGQRRRIETWNPDIAFLPDRIVLIDAEDWVVHDIGINHRSQIRSAQFDPPLIEAIPGPAFSSTAPDGWIRFRVVQEKMSISVDVTYVGPADGGVLTCLVMGEVAAPVDRPAHAPLATAGPSS